MKKFLLLLLMLTSVNLVQAREVTPSPVINIEITDDVYILTATGEGEVILYVNGEAVENPYTVARPEAGEEAIVLYVYATAQEDGKDIGEAEVQRIEVMPLIEEPYDPHERGYWVVLRDRHGREVWQELFYDDYDYFAITSLYYSVYGGFNPETDERAFVPIYFVIDGIRYGAPSANTVTILGYALDNPLIEGDNFYVIPVGYNYNIGVAQAPTGEKYLYAAIGGSALIYDWETDEWVHEDPTQFITGDVDGNAKVTIADITTMIDYLLTGYSTDLNMANADVNGSGKITIEDVTLLIDFLLRGSWW